MRIAKHLKSILEDFGADRMVALYPDDRKKFFDVVEQCYNVELTDKEKEQNDLEKIGRAIQRHKRSRRQHDNARAAIS